MPIYEYQCESCSHTLGALQKLGDDPLVDCPECGQPGLRRLLSAPRFRLKGTGWYETDFKKDNRRNLASDDNKPAKKKDGKTEKPAAKDSGKAKSDSGGGDRKKDDT